MLKIKDNVDLKELEKYGFEYDEGDYSYDFIPYTFNNGEYILVLYDTRKVSVDYISLDYFEEAVDKLYDLIKADLVEKVSDKE